MEIDIDQDWPGASNEDESYCSHVVLAANEEWMREELKKNMNRLGIVFYQDRETDELVIHGKATKYDISEIHKGQKPERQETKGYSSRVSDIVKVSSLYL